MEEKNIAAIDLGTSKFALTVAKVTGNDVQIIYYKEVPSDGIRNSQVFNPMKATVPLKALISNAEEELKIKIMQVAVSLPRYPIIQETAQGDIQRNNPDSSITPEEVEDLKSLALDSYPVDNPDTEEIFGAVAQSFSTDDATQLLENDVIGMISSHMEGDFKIFIGKRNAVKNIDAIFNKLGVAVARKYFVPDAIAKAVLTEEERENGVALIDFGAGVTSVSIYSGRIMRHYAAIPFGGKVITSDIKSECSITERLAENIKLKFGACQPSKLQTLGEKTLQIRNENGEPCKEVKVNYLSEVIDARVKEIINAILYEIQRSNISDNLRSGIVVTGGCANLTNCANLISEISGYSVRVGYPRHLFSASGCCGVFETGTVASVGMILAAKSEKMPDCVNMPEYVPVQEEEEEPAGQDTQGQDAEIRPDGLEGGQTGTLIQPEDFGEPNAPKKKEHKKKEHTNVIWNKVKDTFGSLYDNMTNESV